MSTTTDKPTVDGIRERSKFQRHLVKPSWGEIDFLLAEVERLKAENESSARNATLIRRQAESAKEQSSAYDHRDRDS